ncbi:MAG: hypothetical protein ACE5I3_11245 [Phycisphaerae bacterium]
MCLGPIAVSITMLSATCLGQQSLQLPATSHCPRDREAWHAQLQRLDAAGNLAERFPDEWLVIRERWTALVEQLEIVQICHEALADELVTELYSDYGHPDLNEANQYYLVGFIKQISEEWPEERLPASARLGLLDGLLEYYEAGGGRSSPTHQAHLAVALDHLGEGDAPVKGTVEYLLDDAARWVQQVDAHPAVRDSVYKEGAKHWGDAFWLRAYERSRSDGALPPERPKRYKKALGDLAALLADKIEREKDFLRRLREATEAALVGCGDRRLDDDLTCRLLIVYRCLLARRPGIPDRAAKYIERHLLHLATARRLKTERHWSLWSDAVRELRPSRISDGLKTYVRRLLKTKDLPDAARKAIERLAALVGD